MKMPLFFFLGWLAAASIPAEAADVCIHALSVVSTRPNADGTAIFFTMKDRTIWRNELKQPCPDLKFGGFTWTVPGIDVVCDNKQAIRVLQTGQICMLGRFTKATGQPK
jgi:hypothetical protein